jgi:TolB protein
MRRMIPGCASFATLLVAAFASAQGASRAAPDSAPPPATASSSEEEEVVVDVTTAVNQLPVLLIAAAAESDRPLAEEVRKQVELTGLFATVPVDNLGLGMPERNGWPGLALAAVVIERDPRTPPMFPAVRSTTSLRGIRDEVRRRELTEFPGAGGLTAATMADAILEDVLGIRANMSGKLLVTDASTVGERSIRVMGPDGTRGRRISGFDSLARGGDFGPSGLVSYAAEDANGKLALFREGQRAPVALAVPGYVQGISWAPDASRVALSMGVGAKVATWVGSSFDHLRTLDVGERMSLSPSVNAEGDVVHAVGPEQGPFAIFWNDKQVTPQGMWAATPSFCSSGADKRVVYMVRDGVHWDVRITSITTGLTRTVAMNAMAPACSPDGRTVAYYSPARSGKGPGVYLISDQGGTPHKTWSGTVAALRWARGEPLPTRSVEQVTPPAAAAPQAPAAPAAPAAP